MDQRLQKNESACWRAFKTFDRNGNGKIPRAIGIFPPVVPFCRFCFGEGSPAKIDYRKKGYPSSNLST